MASYTFGLKSREWFSIFAIAALVLVGSSSANYNPYHDVKTATGPGWIGTELMSAGIVVCDPFRDESVLPCDGGGGPTSQPAGGAIFDTSWWNTDFAFNHVRMVRFWAEWDGSAAGEFVPFGFGGFEMAACSDRDDDGICTTALPEDNISRTYSNGGVISSGCGKDDKNCNDPTDSELYMCVESDVGSGGYDNLMVLIGNWVHEDLLLSTNYPTLEAADTLLVEPYTQILFDDPEDDGAFNDHYDSNRNSTGAGISVGSYTIYLEYLSFYTTRAGHYYSYYFLDWDYYYKLHRWRYVSYYDVGCDEDNPSFDSQLDYHHDWEHDYDGDVENGHSHYP